MEIVLNHDQSILIDKLKDWWAHIKSRRQYFVYSGRAGTGKTTVIMKFIEELGLSEDEYICCALIGKAVLVMQKKGLPAKTIHSTIFDIKPISDENDSSRMMFEFILKESLDPKIKLLIVDEGSMIDDIMLEKLLSFGIPLIFTGDMNQLPPVFGNSSIMMNPDHTLTQLMRQAESDPIVWIADQFSHGYRVPLGEYGDCHVLDTLFFGENLLTDYDVILCATNKTREILNKYIRREVLCIHHDKYPVPGDKMICRENKWAIMIDGYSLTNGTVGYVRDLVIPKKREVTKKRPKMKVSFQPDYLLRSQSFKNIAIDLKYLWATPSERKYLGMSDAIKFEYGYTLTTHLSQGSEYPRVLFIDEPAFDYETRCRLKYTAVTRASKSVDILDFNGFKYNKHICQFIDKSMDL